MKPKVAIEGLERASARLSQEIEKTGKQSNSRFITLCLKSVEAQTSPYVPVDNSLLINSAFTRLLGSGSAQIVGEFGYGAEYAGFVHEGGPKNWQKAGASDRFLELGVEAFIKEDLDNLLQILGE